MQDKIQRRQIRKTGEPAAFDGPLRCEIYPSDQKKKVALFRTTFSLKFNLPILYPSLQDFHLPSASDFYCLDFVDSPGLRGCLD
jgi:hypothetical protein